jgi:hypothetical protein
MVEGEIEGEDNPRMTMNQLRVSYHRRTLASCQTRIPKFIICYKAVPFLVIYSPTISKECLCIIISLSPKRSVPSYSSVPQSQPQRRPIGMYPEEGYEPLSLINAGLHVVHVIRKTQSVMSAICGKPLWLLLEWFVLGRILMTKIEY